MKRILLVLVVTLGVVVAINAQPRAIGIRGGYGFEASYQHSMGDRNMLSIDAGLNFPFGLNAAATYDWIFPMSWTSKGEFNFYAGPGLTAGFNVWEGYDGNHSYGYVGIAGRGGLEYQFWFPLQLSVDYRPAIAFALGDNGSSSSFYGGALYSFAFSARYLF